MIFGAHDYKQLYTLFDYPGYAGYRPNVKEIPNGDGRADAEKRYLHVALKYNPPEWAVRYLARAHFEACRIAERLKVPDAYYPRVENGTLRVLEYPEGVGSDEHKDFDLFTVNCWRQHPDDLETINPEFIGGMKSGVPAYHIGEIGELVGLGPAMPHRVTGRPYTQQAIVYFALPANGVRLPRLACGVNGTRHGHGCGCAGLTIAEWLQERLSRSRMYK